jgi:AraC-like DNA-binding protein
MDLLTEALESMRTGHPTSIRTDGYAPWGLRLPPTAGVGFHVVLHGACWLVPVDAPHLEPVLLSTGDVLFLRDGASYVLADHPSTPGEVPAPRLYTKAPPIGSLVLGDGSGGGTRTSLLCGTYHLDMARPHPLVRQLPEVVVLRTRHDRHADLSAAVRLLGAELENPRIGSDGIVPTLIDSLLLYILRAWLEDQPAEAAGWSAALRDRAVAPALAAIHATPSANWTVESLAARSGLSRAAFARRFAVLVGETPMAYLTRWRMSVAAKLLRDSDVPLITVAAETGYSTEFALAKAFKRAYGIAPGGYRRQARAA